MRTIVLILLVALLPLRMWAAESMAMRMAQAEMASTGHGGMAASAMPEDCPMMAKAAMDRPASQGEPASPDHAGCLTCQLCAALAMDSMVAPLRHAIPMALPDRVGHRFASADPLRELKPPIS
jgi:hypothetical protein